MLANEECVRTAIRGALETVLTTSGVAALARRIRAGRVAILAYHNVVSDAEAARGDSSLHLPLRTFLDQLERLLRTHDVVDLDELHSRPPGHRPRAVITFDDAYRGAITLALPELVRRGLPAVVFVAPGLLGTTSTWWDELGEAGRLSPTVREDALTNLAGRATSVRKRHSGDRSPGLPTSYGLATLEELRAHCGAGIRVGSHSWSHEYLPALPEMELRENLARTIGWLESYDGPTSGWLALPYGGGSETVSRAALAAGHAGVLRISGGLWEPTRDRSRVPRINVPAGVSLRGLELRASGLLR
jgi:peptidoglycan/xylan/chitin deacetylase (PgdA/CDA1 family)